MTNLSWMFETAAPKLERLAETPGGLRKKGKVASNPPCDSYDHLVFDGTARLLGVLRRLEHANRMIASFPQRARYERAGISRDIWLEYHYSFFVTSLSSLPDLALLLTNSVLRLGIDPRDCTSNLLKRNAWVKGRASILAALNGIEGTVKTYRELRNLNLHRGEEPDLADFIDSDRYDLLKLIAVANRQDTFSVSSHLLTAGYRVEVSEINSKMTAEIEAAAAAASQLFDALLPIYQATERSLHARPDKGCRRLQGRGANP